MNAAVLLMIAWVAGADPVPATLPSATATIMVEGGELGKLPAGKTTAPAASKPVASLAPPVTTYPGLPAGPVATTDCGTCGGDCCTGGDCGCSCHCRPSWRARLADFFRRLCFWKRGNCGCDTGCGCNTGCCGNALAGTGAQMVSYLPAESTPAGPTTPSKVAAADSVQPVGYQTAEDKPATEERAKVTIVLPAGATLFVDDQPIHAGAGETVFQTPLLKVGESYFYRVRAEVVHGGQPSREEMQVVVRAGEAVRVAFFEAPQILPVRGRLLGR